MENIRVKSNWNKDELDQLNDIPSFRDEMYNDIMFKYEQLLKENKLNPTLHEPVISFDVTGNDTTVKIGVKAINPMKHLSFAD